MAICMVRSAGPYPPRFCEPRRNKFAVASPLSPVRARLATLWPFLKTGGLWYNAADDSIKEDAMAASATPTTGRHFIAGKWLETTGATFPSANPARLTEIVGVFPHGTKATADRAVEAARAAQPAWRRASRIQRADLFDRLA